MANRACHVVTYTRAHAQGRLDCKSRLAQRSGIGNWIRYHRKDREIEKNRSRWELTTVIVEDVAKASGMRLHVGMRSGFLRVRRVAGTAQPAAPSKVIQQTNCGKS